MPFIPTIALNTPTTLTCVLIPKINPTDQIKRQYEIMAKGWKLRDAKTLSSVWANDYTEIQNVKGKAKTVNRKDALGLIQVMLKKWDKVEMAYTIQSLNLMDGGKKAQVVALVSGVITVGVKTKNPSTANMTAKFNHLWVNQGKTWLLKEQSPNFPKKK